MRTLEVVKTLRTPNAVSSVEVEPGQQRYITTADGPNVSFWDGRTLEPIKTHVEAFNVESASLFADRRRFVLGGEDMWVHLHDFDTLKELECNKGEVPDVTNLLNGNHTLARLRVADLHYCHGGKERKYYIIALLPWSKSQAHFTAMEHGLLLRHMLWCTVHL